MYYYLYVMQQVKYLLCGCGEFIFRELLILVLRDKELVHCIMRRAGTDVSSH